MLSVLTALVLMRLIVSGARQSAPTYASPEAQGAREEADTHERADFAQATFFARYTNAQAEQLAEVLVDPAGSVARIRENVSISENWMQVTVDRMVRHTFDEPALFPVLMQRKGEILNDLRVTVDGKATNVLSFVENQGAMLVAIRILFESAFPESEDRSKLLKRALSVSVSTQKRKTDALLADVRSLREHPTDLAPAYKALLLGMIHISADSYYVFCSLAPTELYVSNVSVNLRVTRYIKLSERFSVRVRELLRTPFGLRTHTYVFPLQRAIETVSYHLQVQAPPGMYVYSQGFRTAPKVFHEYQALRIDGDTSATLSPRPFDPTVIEVKNVGFVNVYVRDGIAAVVSSLGKEAPVSQAAIVVEMRERPPGLLEAGAALSTYLAALCWIVGYFHDQVFVAGHVNGSWPTILFGLPTLISGWLVSRITGPALERISLPTVGMTFWIMVNSATAVLVAAFKSVGVKATETGWEHLGVHAQHPLWALLMLSTGLHLALSILFVIYRVARFRLRLITTAGDL